MIINGQFYIFTYTGIESLDLMNIPEAINNDDAAREKYNKFIQSIDTIYGPQNLIGEMPKFWTRLTQVSDSVGNTVYAYEPHPESTLSSLSSLTAYYIILRDSSIPPIKVPALGGEVFGFTDISSLPIFDGVGSCNAAVESCASGGTGAGTGTGTGTTNTQNNSAASCCSQIVLSENNSADITFGLSNMRPFESYIYSIESVAANWPINISPISGIIKPSKDTGKIDVNLMFCPSTGVFCGNNVVDYSVNDNCLLKNNKLKSANIRMSIKPLDRQELEIYSDQYTVVCNDCLPGSYVVNIISPGGGIQNETTIVEDDFDGFAYHEFDIAIDAPTNDTDSKFDNDTNFTYSVEVLEAEWPIIFVSPTGGIITAQKDSNRAIQKQNRFFLCPTSGLCQKGSNNVPDYNVPKYPTFLAGEDILTSVYNVKIRVSVESYDCPGNKVYSNTSTISFIR